MLVNATALHIPLKDKSVQCCVTSPPYWGLRDYGTAIWVDGDDPECEHLKSRTAGEESSTLEGGQKTNSHNQEPYKSYCRKCGAIRIDNQLGLEQTPEEYVENMVAVFREVWRVLRDDGTVWLNLGDSYATHASKRSAQFGGDITDGANEIFTRKKPTAKSIGLKEKDLVGIPWRVAFALQADGWYLRNDIIWHKPNPMPESVKDRCTKSHEYIFLLTKNKKYYYDVDSIREPLKQSSIDRINQPNFDNQTGGPKDYGSKGINVNKSARRTLENLKERYSAQTVWGDRHDGYKNWKGSGRNKRTVWTITPKPYSGAHFAIFPPELPEICIKAGSKEGDTILDPFVGSGTTCMVARDLGRHSVGLDLSFDYLVNNAKKRLELDKLEYWINGGREVEGNYQELPLFNV